MRVRKRRWYSGVPCIVVDCVREDVHRPIHVCVNSGSQVQAIHHITLATIT
jgi:hypothetical protein